MQERENQTIFILLILYSQNNPPRKVVLPLFCKDEATESNFSHFSVVTRLVASKWESAHEPSYNSEMVAHTTVPSHKHLEHCSLRTKKLMQQPQYIFSKFTLLKKTPTTLASNMRFTFFGMSINDRHSAGCFTFIV